MRFKIATLLIITAFSFIALCPVMTLADQDIPISYSPIIIVDSTQTKNDSTRLLLQKYASNESLDVAAHGSSHQAQLGKDDLAKYSLALGATVHINDKLNIGAACGMPLTNDQPLQIEDLTIEAMLTMQF